MKARKIAATFIALATLGLMAPAASAAPGVAFRPATFVITTDNGVPIKGVYVSWHTRDWAITSSYPCQVSDGDGRVSYPAVPIGLIDVKFTSDCGSGDEDRLATEPGKAYLQRLSIGDIEVPPSGDITVRTGAIPDIERVEIQMSLPGGEPTTGIPIGSGGDRAGWFYQESDTATWTACPPDQACMPATDALGRSHMWRFVHPAHDGPCRMGYEVRGALSNSEAFGCGDPGPIKVVLPSLPMARIIDAPASVTARAAARVTVEVLGTDGRPLSGQRVELRDFTYSCHFCSGYVHDGACWDGPSRVSEYAVTDELGRAVLEVCPHPAIVWTAGYDGLVSSGGVSIGSTPGPPLRARVSLAGSSASISWRAANGFGSPILDYTVTAAPDGKSCTASVKTCTITGLTKGQSYTFVVTARNAYGLGLPSNAVKAVVK